MTLYNNTFSNQYNIITFYFNYKIIEFVINYSFKSKAFINKSFIRQI